MCPVVPGGREPGGPVKSSAPRLCAYSRCGKPLPEPQGAGRPARYCLGTNCKELAAKARLRKAAQKTVREIAALQRVRASRAAVEAARESEEQARRQAAIAAGVTEQAETRLRLAQLEAGAEADLLDEVGDQEHDTGRES